MNRFLPRHGTPAPYWRHMTYIADSMDAAFRSAISDYIALSQDFFISGAVITEAPSGASTTYNATAGHVCYKGEVMPMEAQSVTKSVSQVVFIVVQDDGVDVTPVINQDGSADHVMRYRHARLAVASVFPTEYMPLTAPRKEDLDKLRYKGRLVPMGGIVPYYGAMANFDATGLGQIGTPMEGWAVCNGLNGTIDLRGMVPMGATNVPSSGAPAPYAGVMNPSDVGDQIGADAVTLDADQLPAHTHPISFPKPSYWHASGGLASANGAGTGDGTAMLPTATEENTTPGNPVDLRQASRALVFIQSMV